MFSSVVAGLYIDNQYISDDTSDALLREIHDNEWQPVRSAGSRLVQQYGVQYIYRHDPLPRGPPLPVTTMPPRISALAVSIQDTLSSKMDITVLFNQCIVNRYEPG